MNYEKIKKNLKKNILKAYEDSNLSVDKINKIIDDSFKAKLKWEKKERGKKYKTIGFSVSVSNVIYFPERVVKELNAKYIEILEIDLDKKNILIGFKPSIKGKGHKLSTNTYNSQLSKSRILSRNLFIKKGNYKLERDGDILFFKVPKKYDLSERSFSVWDKCLRDKTGYSKQK